MSGFREENKTLVWERNHETVVIQPWGRDSLRVRSTMPPGIVDARGALLSPVTLEPRIEIHDNGALIQKAKIKARISKYGPGYFSCSGAGL